MKLGFMFTVSLLVLGSTSFAGRPAKDATSAKATKKYNVHCRVQDKLSQKRETKFSDLIEVDLSAGLEVKGKKQTLTHLSAYYFTYAQDFQKSISDAKRPSDTYADFGYTIASGIANDPDYKPNAEKYSGYTQFRVNFDGGDVQSAELKLPPINIPPKKDEDDTPIQKGMGALNLHFDQGWGLAEMECSIWQQQ